MSHFTKAVLSAAAFVVLSFFAALALGGVTVTKVPPDSELADCIMAARATVADQPIDCLQRTIITGTCEDVPRPADLTDVVFDPKAAKYSMPEEPQPGVVIRPDGVEYTFTNVGEQTHTACPAGSPVAYAFSEKRWVRVPFRACWEQRSVPTTDCAGNNLN